jgi:radical SAM superfamily enzyme YgiQ (UPF0313 family)
MPHTGQQGFQVNICLIRPPVLVPKFNMALTLTPPLGLAYVAGALRHAGFAVNFIDGVGEGLEDVHPSENDCLIYGLSLASIVEKIPQDTDLIGVSAQYSFEWPLYQDLIKLVRSRFPKTLIAAGGEHITAMPSDCLASSELDCCVLGEGEATVVDMASALERRNRDLTAVPGLAFKTADGRIVLNERRPRIRDLDGIAWPAWDILPIEEYLDRNLSFGVDRGRSLPVLASRGCPYQCAFCSNKKMWGSLWRVRNHQKFLDELQFYQEKYKIRNFDFYDLTAVINKSWIMDFCEGKKRRGLEFTWQLPSGTRSEALDRDSVTAMYESGCRNLSFSPESGSGAVLKLIQKKISLENMLASMRECVRAGLNIKANIIFGFPGETQRHILESFVFIIRMAAAGVHDLSIWAFSPYPGSRLFDQLQAQGKITLDDDFFDRLRSYADASKTVSYNENLSNRDLKILRVIGTLLFYCVSYLVRPWRVAKLIANVVKGKQESRFEMAIVKTINRYQNRKKAKTGC